MSYNQWKTLEIVSGSVKAEILKGLLEAQGIEVVLSQEGIGEYIYPLTVGPLSEIQILVPDAQFEQAQRILLDFEAGTFEKLNFQDTDEDLEPEEKNPDQG